MNILDIPNIIFDLSNLLEQNNPLGINGFILSKTLLQFSVGAIFREIEPLKSKFIYLTYIGTPSRKITDKGTQFLYKTIINAS